MKFQFNLNFELFRNKSDTVKNISVRSTTAGLVNLEKGDLSWSIQGEKQKT